MRQRKAAVQSVAGAERVDRLQRQIPADGARRRRREKPRLSGRRLTARKASVFCGNALQALGKLAQPGRPQPFGRKNHVRANPEQRIVHTRRAIAVDNDGRPRRRPAPQSAQRKPRSDCQRAPASGVAHQAVPDWHAWLSRQGLVAVIDDQPLASTHRPGWPRSARSSGPRPARTRRGGRYPRAPDRPESLCRRSYPRRPVRKAAKSSVTVAAEARGRERRYWPRSRRRPPR